MKHLLGIIIGVGSLLALGSCGSTSSISKQLQIDKNKLFENNWFLASIDGKEVVYDGENFAHLNFDMSNMNKVSGNTGCNVLNGTIAVNDNAIKFSDIATTRMACRNSVETEFLSVLNRADNWSIINNELMLKMGNSVLATLNGVSAENEKLNGNWELTYVSGPKIAFEGLYPDKKPHLIFNFANGIIQGNTGCNGFSSKFKLDGNKIKIEDGLQTMMYCEGGGEDAFKNMMRKTDSYKIENGSLVFSFEGVPVMRFKKK